MAHGAWLANHIGSHRCFQAAIKNPGKTQAAVLSRLLRRNANSVYGKKYDFTRLRSIQDYQSAVPIASYDDLKPFIERIVDGETGVLTAEPVLMLEKTSGSSSAAKYIPYTASLRREFQRAIGAWMYDLYSKVPSLMAGHSYWCISPLGQRGETTRGGLKVGFESDTEYFGGMEQFLLRRLLAVPDTVARVSDLNAGIYVTLRFLLQSTSLRMISVWNPSFLTILIDRMHDYADRLLDDLEAGTLQSPFPLPDGLQSRLQKQARAQPQRARILRGQLQSEGTLRPKNLWPNLKVISCWTDAAAKMALPAVAEQFPGILLQGKGLLASEGVVSIPLIGSAGAALAITSHFYEFLETENERPKLAQELEEGREYSLILTTGGGLWRYALGDRIRVKGFVEHTPLLEFIGKEDAVTDLCGEKLNALFVGRIITQLEARGCWAGSFAMLAPSRDVIPRYAFFLEGSIKTEGFADLLDRRLRENPHYDYCRRLGQLGEPRIFQIEHGAQEIYLRRCVAMGQRAGDVKTTALHSRDDWEAAFPGKFESNLQTERLGEPTRTK
jgi:hypothetical protein